VTRSLKVIGTEIRADWRRVSEYAEEQLQGIEACENLSSRWLTGTGTDAVLGFLSNAHHWRGETARRIKSELRAMLRAHGVR